MFGMNFIAGCGCVLELLWYAGERQLPNKISEKKKKKRGNNLHTQDLYMVFKLLVPNGRNLGPTV